MNNKSKGIICIITAAFGFSMMSVFVALAGELPAFQKAFFRNAVALLVVGAFMIKNKTSFVPEKKENIPFLFGRALFGTVGLVSNFYAIDHLVLADANMLNKLSPFFAVVFSVLLLKEKPSIVQIFGVLAALLGSVLIIKPTGGGELFPALIGLMGGAGAGVAYTFVRRLGKAGEKSDVIIFFFSAFSCLVCLPAILINPEPMSTKSFLCLICAGICACIGQFGITRAYIYAPAKEISVYDYSQVLFAALFGFFLFNQVPDVFSFIGYVLICGAGICMFFL